MIIKEHLRDLIIIPTLERLDMNSDSSVNLLMGTAYQESLGGKYLSQYPEGPARGIYQCEEGTHLDIWYNYLRYRENLRKTVGKIASSDFNYFTIYKEDFDEDVFHEELVFNLRYATAMARIKYFRVKFELPEADDIDGLARYWKSHYNTNAGKGTVEEFIKNYERYAI